MPSWGRLLCLPSPSLLLGDPPCAACSWDPGSWINNQIETDSNCATDMFNYLSPSPLTATFACCVPLGLIHAVNVLTRNQAFDVVPQISRLQRSRMSNNMAKIADARKTVEQLKLEVNIERMMVRDSGVWSLSETIGSSISIIRHRDKTLAPTMASFSNRCHVSCGNMTLIKAGVVKSAALPLSDATFLHRYPKQQLNWWLTAKLTPKRTRWWPQFLPLRIHFARRKYSVSYFKPCKRNNSNTLFYRSQFLTKTHLMRHLLLHTVLLKPSTQLDLISGCCDEVVIYLHTV